MTESGGWAARLSSAFPGRAIVSTGESDRDLHGTDLSFHTPHRPDVVVYPESTADVVTVLAVAHEERLPVTPFGAGSSLEGNIIPERGGISLDLNRMSSILEISPENLTATVQAGVTRLTLDRAAAAHGLTFPVDPGADATLGGMAATNAAGTTTIRYGKMRAQVLALEAVLPGGAVIRTGSRAAKSSAGYDITGLLVGSEGTLAVITELTLRLYGRPEHTVAGRIPFPDLAAACRTAAAAVAAGAAVQRLELVDAWTIGVVNAHLGTTYDVTPTLFVESAGSAAAAEADMQLLQELARNEGVADVELVRAPEARALLWAARHGIADALGASFPGRRQRATDICVPVSTLAGAVTVARQLLDEHGLPGGIFGHAGDGNVHVALMLDPLDADEVARSEAIVTALVADALERGGTCTGEHGVGNGKIESLEREHGDLLPLYRGVKQLFDPHGIMNPGKVLRDP
jgi:D-lactate dehydrogenase (cytochrome)